MIIVKKPFEEIDGEEKKEHEEGEEKPIAEEKMLISESCHGGEESTESLPNTSNNSSNQSSHRKNMQGSSSHYYGDSSQKGEKDRDNLDNSGGSDEKDNKHESRDWGDVENFSETNNGEKEGGTNSDNENDDEYTEGDYDKENDGEGEEYEEKEYEEGEENEDDEGDYCDEVDEEEHEPDEDEEDEESEQEDTYNYNTEQAFSIINNSERYTKYYQTEFYRFLEIISEERTKIFDPRTAEEFNVKKMMLRPFERKPLNHYKQSRVRDSVIMILDNSGSMDWWAENLSILADLALSRNDVEIYIAPNGHVEERFDKSMRIPVSHEAMIKGLNGRKIIYVGDYDGANTPIELSWRNDVVWVCPESRYRRFNAHNWVKYSEYDFKGAFLRVYDLNEMFHAFKTLLSRQYVNGVWIDLHENDEFDDD